MAREIVITGYGLLSPLGENPEQWTAALARPEAWRRRIDENTYAPIPIHPIGAYALGAQVPKPGDQRAMGPMMQYGAYAAGMALDMAGIKNDGELLERTHLVTAAGGGERDLELDRQILANIDAAPDRGGFLNRQLANGLRPTLFLAQLPNLFAGNISLIYGVAGSSRTFMGEESAGIDAVRTAARRIESGRGDIVLVGAGYSAARPDYHPAYHAGGILLTGPWQPLWSRPEAGVVLGSAGAFVVLEGRDSAERRGVKPRARLAAIESGRSVRAPGAATRTAAAQMERIKDRIERETLGVMSGASGRGSITREERAFFERLAGDGLDLAVRGVAAATGHAMECAFLSSMILAIASLERRKLFPPLDPEEPLETRAVEPALRQILVTGWGHMRGEGLALLEAGDA